MKLLSLRGHHFHAGLIHATSSVIDLGAHRGEFVTAISERFACQCYAVEALPSLYAQIQENHFIKKFNYAITNINGPTTVHLSKNPEGSSLNQLPSNMADGEVRVEGVTLETFLRRNNLVSIDLLKVDIEGAEVELFRSLRDDTIREIKQITIEFHDSIKEFNCVYDVKDIKQRLRSLGFFCIVFSGSDNTDVLFLNKKKCNLSSVEYLWLKYVLKYARGLLRVIRRLGTATSSRRLVGDSHNTRSSGIR